VNVYARFHNWLQQEQGQDLAEYALLIGLIALATFGAANFLGTGISNVFQGLAVAIAR
jgi:Flp pilus assembly pilin Flp